HVPRGGAGLHRHAAVLRDGLPEPALTGAPGTKVKPPCQAFGMGASAFTAPHVASLETQHDGQVVAVVADVVTTVERAVRYGPEAGMLEEEAFVPEDAGFRHAGFPSPAAKQG